MYAPMPTLRPVTYDSVNVSAYADEVSPAISPEPRRFSTPRPSFSPTMKSSLNRFSPSSVISSPSKFFPAPSVFASSGVRYRYL